MTFDEMDTCPVCGHSATPAPSPSREGWPTREQVQKELDRLNAMDVEGVHPENQADAFYELEFQRALCDMALSALRPVGDEGLCYVCGKPVSAKDGSDTCKVWTHSWHDLERMRNRAIEAALPAAPKSPASEREACTQADG